MKCSKWWLGFFCFLVLCAKIEAVGPVYNATPIHEGFVTKYTENYTPQIVPKEAPAPVMEMIPSQPFSDALWISGYWAWLEEQNDFTWVCGIWRRPPPGQNWISGYWTKNGEGWSWAQGFWSAVPQNKLTTFSKAPPHSISENPAKSPGKNYFWISGYWNNVNGEYSWLSGKWNPINANWILTPAAYFWRPEGFAFSPLYWDYPLEERGNAYSCQNATEPLTIIQPETIIEQLFICYPSYINLYSYWWYEHPGYWDGCWCLPPWWFWEDWWTFSWDDEWALWWWWGNPEAFPPFWIDEDIIIIIDPAREEMIEFMRHLPKPEFPVTHGDKHLRPKGTHTVIDPIRPHITTPVKPSGTVTLPQLPQLPQITPPQTVTPPPAPAPAPAPTAIPTPTPTPTFNPSQTPNYFPQPDMTPVQPNYNLPIQDFTPKYTPPQTHYPVTPQREPRTPHGNDKKPPQTNRNPGKITPPSSKGTTPSRTAPNNTSKGKNY